MRPNHIWSDRISPSQAHAPVALQDQLPLTDELTHGARHFRFTLDLLDIKILGVLVGPVIGVHRLAERFRGRLPVAVMVAIAMRARLALPSDGIELLGHPLAFPHLLALLRFLTGAIGASPPLRFPGELHPGSLDPTPPHRHAQARPNHALPPP